MDKMQQINLDILIESIGYRQKKLGAMLKELDNVPWWRFIKEGRMIKSGRKLLNEIDKDIATAKQMLKPENKKIDNISVNENSNTE